MEQTCKMLLRSLISRNKNLQELFKYIPDKLLNHNVNGISGNSKKVKKIIFL